MRAAWGMLCVTWTMVTTALQGDDELLDGGRGLGVQGGGRLVQEEDLGLHGQGAGDAQPLLLAAGEERAAPVEGILHLVPERHAAQRLLHDAVPVRPVPCARRSGCSRPRRCRRCSWSGNGLGLWNTMPMRRRRRMGLSWYTSSPSSSTCPRHLGVGGELVHAVDAAHEGRLAAAGRSHDGGDLAARERRGRCPSPRPCRRNRRTRSRVSRIVCFRAQNWIFHLDVTSFVTMIQREHDDQEHERGAPGEGLPFGVGARRVDRRSSAAGTPWA